MRSAIKSTSAVEKNIAIDVLVHVLKNILDRDMRSPHDRIYIIESYDSLVCVLTFAICNGNVNDNSNSMNCMSKYIDSKQIQILNKHLLNYSDSR